MPSSPSGGSGTLADGRQSAVGSLQKLAVGERAVQTVAVAFGSNVGDRHRQILEAADQVASFLSGFRLSPLAETAPVGPGTEGQPAYLNAVGVGESDLPAAALLGRLQAIERAAGRTRPYPNAPRTLDLDLILSGNEIVRTAELEVPHPRFRERRFVLEPLAAIAPDLRDPVSGLTMRALLAQLAN